MRRRTKTVAEQHHEWLTQVETDGPFLALPVLKDIWPQGVERLGDADDRMMTYKQAYVQWQRAFDTYSGSPKTDETTAKYDAINSAWIRLVLDQLAGWQELRIKGGDSRLAGVSAISPGGEISIRPSGALEGRDEGLAALLVIAPPTIDLRANGLDGWAATEVDRLAILLRKSGVESGIVTDGQWWAIVWAKQGKPTGSGMVNALTWAEEPLLRDAFFTLIDQRRFRAKDVEQRLPRLFERSELEAEVITEALGTQVRKSVELLVQAFSESRLAAAERDEADPLTEKPDDVYQAAVTIMMRVVFLLFAEERGMLPTEQLYWDSYAIRDLLDYLAQRAADGEEHLDETYDAWHRLLSVSQALFNGVNFNEMRMPAYGGSLLDPARFPWLYATDNRGLRLKVSDRVMLHVLDSVQAVEVKKERRRISFRDIDVEQIGYIYEGLLGYSCAVVEDEVVLGLFGKDGEEPEIDAASLQSLYDETADSKSFAAALVEWSKQNQPAATPLSLSRLAKLYDMPMTDALHAEMRRLLTPVAAGDEELLGFLIDWSHFIRKDLRGIPLVVPVGGLVVVETPSRRNAGAHYTPRSLAEEVVKYALEPLVYEPGPLQINDEDAWKLKSSTAILDLKVADIAAGSGAFLVAAARFLSARVTEAWTEEGTLSRQELVNPKLADDRAIREVIARCLYGADINATAVEMCKLSLWLISMDKNKPFSFVDDKVFCGNSLLGITGLDQLRALHPYPDPRRGSDLLLQLVDVDGKIAEAARFRTELASPVDDNNPMRSTRGKIALLHQAHQATADLRLIADGIIAASLPLGGKPGLKLNDALKALSWELAEALPSDGSLGNRTNLHVRIDAGLTPSVQTDFERWQPVHWALDAPEVTVERRGFDSVIGNPPFLAGKKIAIVYGVNHEAWMKSDLDGAKGAADLCAHFIRRAWSLLKKGGVLGLIATDRIGQGDTALMSGKVIESTGYIFRARSRFTWPGKASTGAAMLWARKSPRPPDGGPVVLDDREVPIISASLTDGRDPDLSTAVALKTPFLAGIGVYVLGDGFFVRSDDPIVPAMNQTELKHLRPFVNGQVLLSGESAPTKVIDVDDFTSERSLEMTMPVIAAHLRRTVKPVRESILSQIHESRYWAHWDKRSELMASARDLERFIVLARMTRAPIFTFSSDRSAIFSDQVVLIASSSVGVLGSLSSVAHSAWFESTRTVRGAGSYYVVSRCLRTFPWSRATEASEVRVAAESFVAIRDRALERHRSLTKLYNQIDDPANRAMDLDKLRAAQAELDRRVCLSYGWDDLELDHGYFQFAGTRRFTCSPENRAEVRHRLLELNLRRAREHGSDLAFEEDLL